MKKILLGLFCGISFGSIGQNMTLNENSGSSSSYSITDINKITFQKSNVVVETQSHLDHFYIGGVRNLVFDQIITCLLYTSPSPRDGLLSRMPSSA